MRLLLTIIRHFVEFLVNNLYIINRYSTFFETLAEIERVCNDRQLTVTVGTLQIGYRSVVD